MKLLGFEHTKKEAIYLFLIMIALLGFFLSVYAQEKTIIGYQNAYVECEQRIIDYNSGYHNVWGELQNITIGGQNEFNLTKN